VASSTRVRREHARAHRAADANRWGDLRFHAMKLLAFISCDSPGGGREKGSRRESSRPGLGAVNRSPPRLVTIDDHQMVLDGRCYGRHQARAHASAAGSEGQAPMTS